MSKVKITQEQAEMFENHRNNFELLMQKRITENCLTRIDEIAVEDVVKAFIGGYEVEPDFKVGDWVTHESGIVSIITDIDDKGIITTDHMLDRCDRYGEEVYMNTVAMYFRHATPEEIAKEEERRWWAKHDRDVWELKLNDEIRHKESDGRFDVVHVFDDGDINIERTSTNNYMQKEVVTVKRSYISDYYYEVVCFAEGRKDV